MTKFSRYDLKQTIMAVFKYQGQLQPATLEYVIDHQLQNLIRLKHIVDTLIGFALVRNTLHNHKGV